MATTFELIPNNEFIVLKIIRVEEYLKWNPFSGYLYYTRQFTNEYNSKNSDYIDEIILDSIKKVFPDSRAIINKNIFFSGQLEDILESYTGKEDLDFKITFMPDIPFDKIHQIKDMNICSPTYSFNFRRTSFNDPSKLSLIHTHVQAEVPFEKSEEFCEKVKTITFKK